jgi:hypothetical protein
LRDPGRFTWERQNSEQSESRRVFKTDTRIEGGIRKMTEATTERHREERTLHAS